MRTDEDDRPERSEYNPLGLKERTIKESRLHEFGPVTFGAYDGATAGMRSMTDEFLISCFRSDPDRLRAMFESATNLQVPADVQDEKDAPSDTGAAQPRTPAQERRDTPAGRYGLTATSPRPTWAL